MTTREPSGWGGTKITAAAGRSMGRRELLIVENGRFLHRDGDEDEGVPVAIVKVKAVRPFIVADMRAACASYFEEGWLAWELTDVRPVKSTMRVLAARRIYEVDLQ